MSVADATVLRRARDLVARLCRDDFTTVFSPEYRLALIKAINDIAVTATTKCPLKSHWSPGSIEALAWPSLSRVATLTSEGLRREGYYCGHESTLAAVWVESTRDLEDPEEVSPVYEPDRVLVSVGELHGPFRCQHREGGRKCDEETWSLYVSRIDLQKCPYKDGPYYVAYVLKNTDAEALCAKHKPQLRS